MLAIGAKRYVTAVEREGGGFRAVGGTEHSLGGGVVDPPAMRGRDADRRHLWTMPVAQRALDLASGQGDGWASPWDEPGDDGFPVLRRFAVGSPAALTDLPACLGAHPFAPLVEGQSDKLFGDEGAPVALDPGTDLANWAGLGWRDSHGAATNVGVRPGRGVTLRVLDEWALGWCKPVLPEPVGLVEVDAKLIRRVGRGGALIDALLADPEARAEDFQVMYDEGDPAAFVAGLVRAMGRKPFAAAFDVPLRTVHDLARGACPDPVTTALVLDAIASGAVAPSSCAGCGGEVWRPGARFCTSSCRETAKARRRRGAGGVTVPVCALPKCSAPARLRSETCSERHRKALGRLRAREGDGAVKPDDDTFYWRPTLDPVTGLAIGPRPDFAPTAKPATPMPWEETFPDWEHSTEPAPDVEVFPRWWEGYAPSERWPA
jgi:hypothetical protein